ncbi:7687_t:CDS:2 [Ambispora gerdemannii]|uniref:7687_t:CDS:1 n=1 Tax=Ambispora gerdemannii TaxID=144530 RepID=A0A9N9C2K8_9GLOM|nr:7687_t:CDS:2 [Ambispora gerdemannii]
MTWDDNDTSQMNHVSGGGKLSRSSHTLTVIDNHAYIFGGELTQRVSVDNTMYIYKLGMMEPSNLKTLGDPVLPETRDPGNIPEPRVGAASATIGHLIFLWGGREMCPNSGLTDPPPIARSYHAMTASQTHLYIYGGCPVSGRLNDLYSYNPLTSRWTTLPASTGISPRGGSALVYHRPQNKLVLFGGFNGKTETDDLYVFDVAANKWHESRNFIVSLPNSNLLVAMYGELDPSPIGHADAGKFWEDVWRINAEVGDNQEELAIEWDRQHTSTAVLPNEVESRKPTPRGWFQVAGWNEKVVLSGGLNSNNERLDDLWF